jgi:hypothetical protein
MKRTCILHFRIMNCRVLPRRPSFLARLEAPLDLTFLEVHFGWSAIVAVFLVLSWKLYRSLLWDPHTNDLKALNYFHRIFPTLESRKVSKTLCSAQVSFTESRYKNLTSFRRSFLDFEAKIDIIALFSSNHTPENCGMNFRHKNLKRWGATLKVKLQNSLAWLGR